MIHPDEMWDAPDDLIDDDEPEPTLRIVPAPYETPEQRLERDRLSLERLYQQTFPQNGAAA